MNGNTGNRENWIAEMRERERLFVLHLLTGILVGIGVGAATIVAAVETQVALLRDYVKTNGPKSPTHYDLEPTVTWPRRQYRKLHRALVIPAVIGAIAGLAYSHTRLRKGISLFVILTIPALFGTFEWHIYATSHKPHLQESLKHANESARTIQRFRETGVSPKRRVGDRQ